ncbi:MAG: glycosyltransferase family 4 protein [Catalinimonas sp.]
MKQNLLLVWDRLGDYHRARWRALQAAGGERRVYAADLGAADALYGWQNTDETETYLRLSDKPVTTFDLPARLRNFQRALDAHDIGHVALAGYGRPEYLAMLWAARRRGCRTLLFAESWYGANAPLNRAKGAVLNRAVDGWLVSGVRAFDHFRDQIGVDPARMRTGYSVVDNAHFATGAPGEAGRKPVLLCVARFALEKNLDALIRAFLRSDLAAGWELRIVGGGPLRDELEALARPEVVTLHDWVSYDELPNLYAAAAAFVLPSTFEPWGLVVNEAMAAGLPVLVSHECGCAPDLVDAATGWRFHASHEDELIDRLNQLSTLPEADRKAMGQSACQKIDAYSPATWAHAAHELLTVP